MSSTPAALAWLMRLGGRGVAASALAFAVSSAALAVPSVLAANTQLSLTFTSMPNPVVFENPLLIEGRLAGIPFDNAERRYEVVLEADPFPYRAGFRPIGEPELTNGTGGFSFAAPRLAANAQLRMVIPNSDVASPAVLEEVAVHVSLHVGPTSRRGYIRLYGTVAPPEPHALVGFQRSRPGLSSLNEGGAEIESSTSTVSSFSRILRLAPGVYQALVEVPDKAQLSNYSPPVLIH